MRFAYGSSSLTVESRWMQRTLQPETLSSRKVATNVVAKQQAAGDISKFIRPNRGCRQAVQHCIATSSLVACSRDRRHHERAIGNHNNAADLFSARCGHGHMTQGSFLPPGPSSPRSTGCFSRALGLFTAFRAAVGLWGQPRPCVFERPFENPNRNGNAAAS